jgi:hypothetical protein
MSDTLISQIRHLQERLAKAERERDEALAALRPFADEHRWARIAPRSAFARAAELAELVPEEK